jgi:two-component system LytT family response regulator
MFSQIDPDKLTAIIVDDELHGRENLKYIIQSYCPEIEILGLADSVVKAIELVSVLNPELVFLDINMPVLDGFDFLQTYNERNFIVVFVSAHEEFGINAVKVGAADYILKPINIKELKQTIKKLLLMQSKASKVEIFSAIDKIVIPTSHGFNVLDIEDIIHLEADGCYTTIAIKNGKNTLVSRTLKDFEDTLPQELFFRVHKSHLINLNHIKDYSNISGGFITMIDGRQIEISRRKAPFFIQKIKCFLKSV